MQSYKHVSCACDCHDLLTHFPSYHPHWFSAIISAPFKVPCPRYLLSNLSHVSSRQHLQVREESASFKNLLVLLFIEFWSKEDVVLDSPVLNPGLLRDIGCGALNSNDQTRWQSLSQKRRLELRVARIQHSLGLESCTPSFPSIWCLLMWVPGSKTQYPTTKPFSSPHTFLWHRFLPLTVKIRRNVHAAQNRVLVKSSDLVGTNTMLTLSMA